VTQRPHTDQSADGSGAALALALAEVLATRLCHDLAGCLGTLMGALELANDDPSMLDEALPVAREAAEVLGARLRLIRTAWGRLDTPMSGAELRNLASGLPIGRRVTVELDGIALQRSFSPDAARLLLNLLMLGVESLAGEGVLAMAEMPGGEFVLGLSGPRAAWPSGFAAMLTDPQIALKAAADQGARHLQGPLVALIAHSSGRRVALLLAARAEAAPPLIVSLG